MKPTTSPQHPYVLTSCINRQWEGKQLEGVRYERKVFRIHGLYVEGVFPVFEGYPILQVVDERQHST